ncbi:hypothetical protein K9U34_02580 [Lawsonia intracellularis]|uniref:NA n=1 Tax=Lawsonia intracellularis (strain PHE/MN1-00) TaxID=363253 RepID=Q1MS97_LAWIP|nr:hypothetical protein [Lawsonia intracellularis]AGC49472.1 hypothetical protein LAW_00071 [Lawsonia intracellularis N343]KAA0204993.1 hypothetical protein C4K43_00580 [Lawsonia intracellularis]MBZ3892484.1 hypothetical protein [Lawsonia intracellularis]OMQ06135.1 hypothetical protein BW722_00410 [Lawsonia intracellularis]RBN32458.1 hypothetical protein DR194_05795 [Lawsonia intracellularis]
MPITITLNAPRPQDFEDNTSVNRDNRTENTRQTQETSSKSATSSSASSFLHGLCSNCRQLGGAMARVGSSVLASATLTVRNLGVRAVNSYAATQVRSGISRLADLISLRDSQSGPRGPEITVSYNKDQDKVTFHDPYNRGGFSSSGSSGVSG